MVIPSSSRSLCRPHIGSLGCGGFFATRPESQWPAALPAQQGMFDLANDALAILTGSEATKRHKNHKTPREKTLCFL
jgi:hypothetical protein